MFETFDTTCTPPVFPWHIRQRSRPQNTSVSEVNTETTHVEGFSWHIRQRSLAQNTSVSEICTETAHIEEFSASTGAPNDRTPLLLHSQSRHGATGITDKPRRVPDDDGDDGDDTWGGTSLRRELKILAKRAFPLMITFPLQYSLTVASIFSVAQLGSVELGAATLASMTANITGYAIYQGMATSVDTLCSQAYGSGRKDLVGLHVQRMVYFLWAMTVPIGIMWFCADRILMLFVPDEEIALLVGKYLKVLLLGTPGYVCFESGKRFAQAQGVFTSSLFTMVICAPLNVFLNWLFVWKFEWGFIGAPFAVAITDNILPFVLFLYIRLYVGLECWPGFSRAALTKWKPMIKLAIPGFLMVEAEILAFEILTLAAARFGTTVLAAQSILSTCLSIAFQFPFPLAIAASSRIANLIGSGLTDAARTAAKVGLIGAVAIGLLNFSLLLGLRESIPRLLTRDPDVINLVASVLPICASFQLLDALSVTLGGVLRGLGRQVIGGYAQMFCYYGIAMPVSMGAAFGLGWGLWGMWTGVALGLFSVCCIEGLYVVKYDWERAVVVAKERDASL